MGEVAVFEVRQAGTLSIVGFRDDGVPNHFYHEECMTELEALIQGHNCSTIIFDLANVDCLASGLMGLLTWLKNKGVRVQLKNVRGHLQSMLQLLKLDGELLL